MSTLESLPAWPSTVSGMFVSRFSGPAPRVSTCLKVHTPPPPKSYRWEKLPSAVRDLAVPSVGTVVESLFSEILQVLPGQLHGPVAAETSALLPAFVLMRCLQLSRVTEHGFPFTLTRPV